MKGLVARMQDVAVRQGQELRKNMPGVRNGDPDAIHDARVATRRIRAVLQVVADDDNATHVELGQEMRTLGRALGAARDLDVVVELFEEKIWQVPDAARAVVALSRSAVDERTTARRELIKTLERSPLVDFEPSVFRRLRAWHPGAAAAMAANLRRRMHEQSTKLAEAVDHASGVYFPNRAHEVRIHTKRLRYLAELAADGSRSHDDRELMALKRVQSVLGNLHDRELIMERLERYGEQAVGFEALRQRLIAERDGLFKDYLSRRDELREVAESIRARTAAPARNWIPLAAMLALPSALVIALAGRRRMRASAQGQSGLRPMPHTPLPTGRAPWSRGDIQPRSSQSTHSTS